MRRSPGGATARQSGDGLDAAWAFGAMAAAFATGGARSEGRFAFAGHPVRLRALGVHVAGQVGASFAHLREPDGCVPAPVLTLDLWSAEETGIPCPVADQESLAGPVLPFDDGTLRSSPDGRYVLYRRDGSASVLDRKDGRLVAWWRRADLPVEDRAKPLNQLLAIWHSDRGLTLAHAAFVSADGKGILLAGPSGAGKSTLALACLCDGFDYLGDDYVGLELSPTAEPVGHALYSAARVTAEQLRRLPGLASQCAGGPADDDRKALVLAHDAFPARVPRSAPVRGVVLPAVARIPRSRVCAITKGRALLRMAYSSLRIPPSPADGMDRLGGLLQRLPVCALEVGQDLASVPGLLRGWLEECAQ